MTRIKIKAVKNEVIKHLTNNPHLRDNDNRLIATIWHNEVTSSGMDTKTLSSFDFLLMYAEGKLSNSESIRRCRQKVQELNPGLRGENYKARHKEQSNIKDDLNNFKNG